MADLDKEIDQVVEQLEKSSKSPKEVLFDTIRQLGPDGVRAKFPTLEKSEQELLISALEEMKKAVEMDKDYQAKFVQGKIKDTVIQEDKADDDQDEKLMKPDAAKFDHQGTPTPGWEGQVIKGKMSKDEAKDKLMEMEEKEHGVKDPKKLVEAEKKEHEGEEKKKMKKSVEILQKYGRDMLVMYDEDIEKAHVGFEAVSREAAKHGASDPDAVAAAVGRKKYGKERFQQMAAAGKKKVKKSESGEGEVMEKKMGVPKGVDPAKQERCVRKLKGEPGKNPYAICNASMKKGEVTDETKAALFEIRKSVEEQLKNFGVEATPALVKAEMKRLLAEEDQDGDAPEMNEKTRANKEEVDALKLGDDNKKAQKKVDDEKQGQGGSMKKSVPWAEENALLKAMTGGRNHHFSLEEYVAEVLKAAAKPAEELKKSEGEKKEDLNDIIEKGGDRTWDHLNTDRMLKANKEKIRGKVVKSFEDNEIAAALGLTEEEAKKILGE